MPSHCDRRSDEDSAGKDRRRLAQGFFRGSLVDAYLGPIAVTVHERQSRARAEELGQRRNAEPVRSARHPNVVFAHLHQTWATAQRAPRRDPRGRGWNVRRQERRGTFLGRLLGETRRQRAEHPAALSDERRRGRRDEARVPVAGNRRARARGSGMECPVRGQHAVREQDAADDHHDHRRDRVEPPPDYAADSSAPARAAAASCRCARPIRASAMP